MAKVETYLRTSPIKPYEAVDADVRKAPRQQFPVVDVDGARSRTLQHDRRRPRREAREEARRAPSPPTAPSRRVPIDVEEHLYFVLSMRWSTDDGFAVWSATSLKKTSSRKRVSPRSFRASSWAASASRSWSGRPDKASGRMPRAEVVATAAEKVLDAFSDFTREEDVLHGRSTDDPRRYGVHAFAAGIAVSAWDNEVRKYAVWKKNLVDYEKRLREAY